jgi:ribonuclease HI
MEITAACAALEWIAASQSSAPVDALIVTDSTYVLRGVTEWMANWKRRGWKTLEKEDVANRDLWERLDRAASSGPHVRWRHIPGHSGYPGNTRADEIASEFALGRPPKLYAGPYEGYGFDLSQLAAPGERPSRERSRSPRNKAYSYVSVVDGVVSTHATWEECERRVKGRSGARYKKATSAAEERALVREWGGAIDDPLAGR